LINDARASAQRASLSAEQKEDSLDAGLHVYDGLSFILSRPLTSPTSKDISGYSINEEYIALIPSSEKTILATKANTVVVDPETQTLNELTELVEKTGDGVYVYRRNKVDQYSVFTEIRMTLGTSPCNIDTSNIKDIKAKCSYPAYANWNKSSYTTDPTLGRPLLKEIGGKKEIKAGAGAYAKATANAELLIQGLTNIKLSLEMDVEAAFGALIRIDPITWVLKKEFVIAELNFPLTNPAISFKILGFKFTAAITLDVKLAMSDIVFTMSAPIEYYKGYVFNLHKSVVLTKNGCKQSEWQHSIKQVPSPMSLETAATTFINNAKLELTPSVTIQVSATFKCGSVASTALHVGVTAYVPFQFGASTVNCPAPYLYGSVQPRIVAFIKFDGLKVAGKALLKEATFSKTIYQMKKYQTCLFNAKSTKEGNKDIIQQKLDDTYVIRPTSIMETQSSMSRLEIFCIIAKSGTTKLNSIAYPAFTISNSMPHSIDNYMILNKPPKDTKLTFGMLFGTSVVDLYPARSLNLEIKSLLGYKSKVQATITSTQNVDAFKEFTQSKDMVSFNAPYDGTYVHIRGTSSGYSVSSNTKFFDETLITKAKDETTGEYVKSGRFFKITFLDIKNTGKVEDTLTFNFGYVQRGIFSSLSVKPLSGKNISAKEANLGDWSAIISTNNGDLFLNSTTNSDIFGSTKPNWIFKQADILKYSKRMILTAKKNAITMRLQIDEYSPVIIASVPKTSNPSVIARKFTAAKYSGSQVTTTVKLNSNEYYGVLRFPFSSSVEKDFKKVYAIVKTDGLVPLIDCEEIGESSYAIPVNSLATQLFIPFRKAVAKSQYSPSLVCLICPSDSGSIMQSNNNVYTVVKSSIVYAGAIINSKSIIKYVNSIGPNSGFRIATRRTIDSDTEIAICSISGTSGKVMMIDTLVNIPEDSMRIMIDTSCYANALKWGYSDLQFNVVCGRASKVYVTQDSNNQKVYLTKSGSSFVMKVTKSDVYYAYPVCSSTTEAFCLIEETFNPNLITVLDYDSDEGVTSNSTLGEGFKREVITGVKAVSYTKTWKGSVQRIATISQAKSPLTLVKSVSNGKTNFCFKFGVTSIPASRSKYIANPTGFLKNLGVMPTGEEFDVDDIEITDTGCISAKNEVATGKITLSNLKNVVDVDKYVSSVSESSSQESINKNYQRVDNGKAPFMMYAAIALSCVAVVSIVAFLVVACKPKKELKIEASSELAQQILN
jgi:hypothetical protein